jgi:hypothetical protein
MTSPGDGELVVEYDERVWEVTLKRVEALGYAVEELARERMRSRC